MAKKNISILILIIFLGAALRLSFLTFNPPSLNWDEVSQGYNAYSILKTGKDEWGKTFPLLNFRAYGDYPTTLNLYLTIPFIAILGLNEFAIRLPHAILGILTIIAVYFLAWGVSKNEKISLLSAFLVTIEPWYVFTSRFVLQANLAIFLLAAAMSLFFNREKNKWFLPLSLISLFLTLFAYHTTRIFSPLLLLALVLIYGRKIFNRGLTILIIFFFIVSALILKNPESRARSGFLFLIDQGAVNKIIEARNSSRLPFWTKRLIYNRPVYFVKEFSKNYLSYFSPKFLFFEGGTQYQYSIPKTGLLYLINLPFFYLGLILLIKKARGDKNYKFLLVWLLLSPIPASLTNEKFTVLRATTMLPLPEILTALGVISVLKYFPLMILYFALIFLSSEKYLINYFTDYRINYSWSWQYGYKQAVSFAKENYDDYDKIIVTKKYGEPHEFFLFYGAAGGAPWPWNPAKYRSDLNLIRFYQSNWWWVDRFDKFYFVNDWQVKEMKLESGDEVECKISGVRCLLITSPGNYPANWEKLETINFLDGKTVFEIYNNIKTNNNVSPY